MSMTREQTNHSLLCGQLEAAQSCNWQVVELIPHRPPMLLLDTVKCWSTEGVVCELVLTAASRFVEAGRVRGICALEWCAQAVAVHAGCVRRAAGRPPALGFIVSSREMEFLRPHFEVGEQASVIVKLQFTDGRTSSYDCQVFVAGECRVSGALTVYQPDPAESATEEAS